MIRQTKLEQIIHRLQNPENTQKLEKARAEPGYSIIWHLDRAKTALKRLPTASDKEKKLLELDFSVSIREIEKLMSEQGWE